MIPCSCAASNASAICFAIGSASSIAIAPRAMRCDKILALDEFHHQRTDTAGFFEPVDVRDIRMVQGRERLGFAGESREPVRVTGEQIREDLERDIAVELRVARAVDLAHAAGANGGDHFIGTETGAGSEGQPL